MPFAHTPANLRPINRPLRIEFPGGSYHVTSRCDQSEPNFKDHSDRAALLGVLEEGMQRFDAQVLDYCLMGNQDPFVLHTLHANLWRLMRRLNGVVTQAFNRRHRKVGHLFQGRFKAILLDRDAYLLEVGRYVELNPVARPRMVSAPMEWPWSSTARPWARLKPPASPGKWLTASGLFATLPP